MAFFLAYGAEHLASAISDKRQRRLAPHPPTLDELCARLKRNEIIELDLGWRHSDFINHPRAAMLLERALKLNCSVTSVSIGWRHHCREALIRILLAVGKYTKITHLRIVLDDWIPVEVIQAVLAQQALTLKSVDLHSVQVLHKGHDTSKHYCCEHSDWRATSVCFCDHNVVSQVIVRMPKLCQLKVIHLNDCDLNDSKAVLLADFLHIRGGISELSLRSNRRIQERGLTALCQAPVMKRLDLSLCDIGTEGAIAIASSIAKRPWPLDELLLCGNYCVGTTGLVALTDQHCCDKLRSLNISYCDLGQYRTVQILTHLRELHPSTAMQEITMQGSLVANEAATLALQSLLQSDGPLRVVRINDPVDPKKLDAPGMVRVVEGLKENYQLEEIYFDSENSALEVPIMESIQFLLRLNRAGRRFLRYEIPAERSWESGMRMMDDNWLQVLSKAGDDLDVLFWLVREGAEQFERVVRR